MSNFTVVDQPLPGVFLLGCPYFEDHRGDFTKLFNCDDFSALGCEFLPLESYISCSDSGVVRGIHFQVDGSSHDKLVCCLKGSVLDVVVDIRPASPYFNKPISIKLSESLNTVLLIGKGYGHGFLSLEDRSMMLYSTSTVYNKALDRGVLWSSINFDWPIVNPIISERDSKHPPITDLL